MVDNTSSELEAFRLRRQQELQQQLAQQAQQQANAEVESQAKAVEQNALDTAMRTILSPEARGRLTNVSLVDPSRAELLKKQLVNLHQESKISIPVSDETVEENLNQPIQEPP